MMEEGLDELRHEKVRTTLGLTIKGHGELKECDVFAGLP